MTSRIARCATHALTIATLALAVQAAPARAQTSLESVIRQYSASSVEGYIQPLADVLVATLGNGLYHSAYIAKSKLSFGLEAVGMTAVIDDNLKFYTAHTPTGWTPATFTTPTIFGGTASVVNHSTISGLSYRGSDGILDADYFPNAVPQLRLGGIMGTEVLVRYYSSSMVSAYPDGDLPELKLLGFGLRHSVSQYLKGFPVDVAVGFASNSLTLGDIVDLKSTSFGLQVGKGLGILDLVGGIASEGGTMDLSYTSTDPQIPGSVNISLDVKRAMRFSAGAGLKLGFLHFFGEAGFGDVNTYSAGLRLGF